MKSDTDGLVKLDESGIELAAETLAKAFMHYPVFVYVYPDNGERGDRLPHFFKSMVHKGILQGEVYAASPEMDGVAVWLPPGVPGGLSNAYPVDEAAFQRFSYYGSCVYGVREKHAPPRHWFLELIGVIPDAQGKGYASLLLKDGRGDVVADGVGVRILDPELVHAERDQLADDLLVEHVSGAQEARAAFRVAYFQGEGHSRAGLVGGYT